MLVIKLKPITLKLADFIDRKDFEEIGIKGIKQIFDEEPNMLMDAIRESCKTPKDWNWPRESDLIESVKWAEPRKRRKKP